MSPESRRGICLECWAPEPEQCLTESPYKYVDLTRNSGGIAVLNGSELSPRKRTRNSTIAYPGPVANLPIAHRLARSSANKSTLVRTYTRI
jgi:hypothetical protein